MTLSAMYLKNPEIRIQTIALSKENGDDHYVLFTLYVVVPLGGDNTQKGHRANNNTLRHYTIRCNLCLRFIWSNKCIHKIIIIIIICKWLVISS